MRFCTVLFGAIHKSVGHRFIQSSVIHQTCAFTALQVLYFKEPTRSALCEKQTPPEGPDNQWGYTWGCKLQTTEWDWVTAPRSNTGWNPRLLSAITQPATQLRLINLPANPGDEELNGERPVLKRGLSATFVYFLLKSEAGTPPIWDVDPENMGGGGEHYTRTNTRLLNISLQNNNFSSALYLTKEVIVE